MYPFSSHVIGRTGPMATGEFRRVEALPRRVWEEADDLEELRVGLTDMLKTPSGTMELRLSQAAALREAHDHEGLFAPIAVGEGKSLITLLAPVVCEAERPLLLVPAAVRDQTFRKVVPEMSKHWQMHPELTVLGYSELSLAKNANILEQINPDMIIADECHALKATRSGRTKRVKRFMRENPSTTFIALSGTVTNHSIMDYWHILDWVFGREYSPLPSEYYEAVNWSEALDARMEPYNRRNPGALIRFCVGGENVRQGYRRRLTETPGVLATKETRLGTSLVITERKVKTPEVVTNTVSKILDDWETPDGEIISEATDLWRTARSALCGFFYKWDPPPPADWMDARKDWKRFVRETLRYNRRKLDTELQVWNECAKATRPVAEWTNWKHIKDAFKPNPVAVWFDRYLVRDAAKWLSKKDRALCWVDHVPVGEAISEESGVKYYGSGDNSILDATGKAIVSIRAHGTGKNLQHAFDKNLVTCPPPSGKVWEQLLGRTHRQGQESDEVSVEVYQQGHPFVTSMTQAVADAVFLQDTLGNSQRLLYCTRTIPKEENE